VQRARATLPRRLKIAGRWLTFLTPRRVRWGEQLVYGKHYETQEGESIAEVQGDLGHFKLFEVAVHEAGHHISRKIAHRDIDAFASAARKLAEHLFVPKA
jgi:hypothetical protein